MNLHFGQSIEARVETLIQASVPRHIITPQTNGPIMGLFQNGLIASYLLTRHSLPKGKDLVSSKKKKREKTEDSSVVPSVLMLKKKHVSTLFMAAHIPQEHVNDWCKRGHTVHPTCFDKDPVSGTVRMARRVCGRCAISVIFPSTMKWERKTDTDEARPVVKIERGILTPESGPLCSTAINKGNSSILAHVCSYYGEERGEQFLTEATRFTDEYMPMYGFSMGWGDCMVSDMTKIKETLNQTMIECDSILSSTNEGPYRELLMNNTLNSAMNFAPAFVSTSMQGGEENSFVILKKSGTKGSDVNLAQIAAFVGQQNTQGQRPKKKLTGGTRCQNSFRSGDDSPAARGFIANGYLHGITPEEGFFHCGSARVAVIDTSSKTADIGYESKKIGKKNEDMSVRSNGSVLDAKGNIIVFVHGDDGFDPKKLKSCKGVKRPFFADLQTLADLASFESKNTSRKLLENEISSVLQFVYCARKCDQHLQPVRLASANMKNAAASVLKSVEIGDGCIVEFCKQVKLHVESCKSPDSMAGLLASCSLSEVASQLTLSMHRAIGRSDVDITVSFPKFKQYINATKTGTAMSTFQFSPGVSKVLMTTTTPESNVSSLTVDVANKVSCLKMSDVIDKIELLHDGKKKCPLSFLPYERYSKPWWEEYNSTKLSKKINNDGKIGESKRADCVRSKHKSEWVLRLHLKLSVLYQRRLHPELLIERIKEECGNLVVVTRSPVCVSTHGSNEKKVSGENMISPVIDISLNANKLEKEFTKTTKKVAFRPYFAIRDTALRVIQNIVVDGIEAITKTSVDLVDGTFKVKTEGSDLSTLMCCDFVDQTTAISDGVWDVYHTLGVEAARSELFASLKRLISFGGSYINDRHYQLVTDRLMHTGFPSGANHSGLDECPPLSRIMFERPIPILSECCAFGDRDDMKGVSSSVMFGKAAKISHNLVEVKSMDTEPIL